MIPIDFILNFQVSSAKASGGIKKMSSSVEQLAQTAGTLNNNFSTLWNDFMPDSMKKNTTLMYAYQKTMQEVFNGELFKNFGNSLSGISNQFKFMYRDANNKEMFGAFSTLQNTLKELVPYVKGATGDMGNMLESLIEIRKAGDASSIKNLTKSIETINKSFHDFNKNDQEEILKFYENFAKSDKTEKHLKNLNKELDAMIAKKETMESFSKAFSSVFGMSPTIEDFRQKLARATGAFSAWDDALEAQDAMSKSIQRLGISANKSFGSMMKSTMKFSDAALATGLKTQTPMKETTAAMTNLLDLRVTDKVSDLEELGTVSIQMSQAFGMSNQEAGQFIKSLYKIGGLSKAQLRSAADAMANVQNSLGLTASEASAVAAQVGSMARTMKVFGGKITDVKKLTTGVAKLNVAFEKAGLSASEANDMLTKMLDPDKLEDNILLYQGLGMSASDAIGMMTGDTSKLGDMDERMVQLAKSLKAQYGGNVFALKEMSAQYGMTLEQVQQLSGLTKKDLEMKKEEASLADAAEKSRASMNEQWKRLTDTLNVLIQSFVLPLVNLLTVILQPLVKIGLFVNGLIGKLHEMGGAFDVLGKVISAIIGAGFLAFVLGITLNFGKMLPLVGNVTKGLFSMKDGLGGIAKNAKDAIKNMLKLNKVSPKDLASKIQPRDANGRFTKNPAAQVSGKKDNSGAMLKTLSNIKPKQLLALGAAILFIAIGIALIVLSISNLAKAMKELNPEQMTALIQIMAIVMGGMILIMLAFALALFILGAAGIASAGAIFAVGAAIFLVAAGIALIIFAVSFLVKTIAESADGILKLAGNIGTVIPAVMALSIGLGTIAFALYAIALATLPAVAGLTILSGTMATMILMLPVITALGNAFTNMGAGIKNISDFGLAATQSLTGLRDSISAMGGNFSDSFVKQLGAINSELQKMSLGSVIIGAGASLLKGIMPEKSNASSGISEGTDRVASLIAESNSYLSAIRDNTDKIVKILSDDKKEEKPSYSRTYSPKNLINKEA